ncbi:hypothetical protein FM104_14650 [Microbacterium esteraromaticum]|uniref:Uncharacterized protein n=1 Tax=Microbacterium esteraromaticum TaxID=57043 RepID=A0A1R4KPK6_9MICO|nr:hypothetical protein [Microbacterium esteraromaticum]SJN46189.1 hypothetical protein FM104_14650 [Microbacterium esteraromaticum]
MVTTIGPSGGSDSTAQNAQESKSEFDSFTGFIDGVVDIINGGLGLVNFVLPDGIMDRINSWLEKMFAKVQEAIDKVAQVFAYVGSPSTLRNTGLDWVRDVGTPAQQCTATLLPTVLPTTGNWEGKAYDAYQLRVDQQGPASDDVLAKCNDINTQLDSFAGAIENFWIGMLGAVVSLVIGVLTTAAALAGVVTAPVAIGTIIGAVGVFLTFLIDGISAIMTANQGTSSFVVGVTNTLSSTSAFPGGAWPRHAAA